ncbi:hypothetical protein OPQ81_004027 [Rhizoctonia solani]|nr:hypothetical protein OPQ81_004027 [Rhizoctonia solani]
MVRLASFRFFAIGILFGLPTHADPWTNVTCTNPNTAWTFNSLQQSPCLVASYLGSVCRPDNTWRVPELTGGSTYYISGSSTKCICTSVVWSLLAACSLCQGLDSSRWTVYANDCTAADTSPPGIYPAAIPSGVAVPNWAYYDYVTAGVFNQVIASQQSGPESTAPPGPSRTATSAATEATSTSTSTAVPINNGSGSSNTGAIVGGVVGGVLGIALVALIAFVVVRKNKQAKPGPHELPPSPTELSQPTTTQFGGAPSSYGQYQAVAQPPAFAPAQSYYKPYDPSDPSTFPTDPYANSVNPPESVPPLSYSQHGDTRPSHYHGVPEL